MNSFVPKIQIFYITFVFLATLKHLYFNKSSKTRGGEKLVILKFGKISLLGDLYSVQALCIMYIFFNISIYLSIYLSFYLSIKTLGSNFNPLLRHVSFHCTSNIYFLIKFDGVLILKHSKYTTGFFLLHTISETFL